MADRVQQQMELIAEEVNQMQRIQLFKPEETRQILDNRRRFEYKLAGPTKQLQDYQDYIKYELDILNLIDLRRRKLKITDKRHEIDFKVGTRIHHLYETAVMRFPNNEALCLAFFKFGKQKFTKAADCAVLTLMKKHSHKPQIWQICAKWYAFDKDDVALGLETLDKGRAIHKNSPLLYMESVKLEILRVTGRFAAKREQTEEDSAMASRCNQRLNIYLEEMFVNIKDCNFYINLLKFLESHKFTSQVQIKIVKHLLDNYSQDPLMWHTVAQREYVGFHYEPKPHPVNYKGRLTLCFACYNKGLESVPDSKIKELWKYYLEFLIEQLQDPNALAKLSKTETLKDALYKAGAQGHLEEKHYLKWLEIAENEQMAYILEQSTKMVPQSVELWKLRLQYLFSLMKNPNPEIDRVFRLGVDSLKENSLPLWSAMIRYRCLVQTSKDMEELYLEAVRQHPKISSVIKPQYIEWLGTFIDINRAREKYKELANERPYCKQLHLIMMKLEESEVEYNYEPWQGVHKLACDQFGDVDEDVWIKYIEFFTEYNTKVENKLEIIQGICKKAQEKLPTNLFIDFQNKFKKIELLLGTESL